MKKILFLSLHALIAFSLLGCTMDVSQPTISSPTETATTSANDVSTPTHPTTWARLGLLGKLVYISTDNLDNAVSTSIKILDLSTGAETTVFTAPEGAWIFYMTVSPDAKQLAMSYVPPAQPTSSPSRILYIMPMDGSKPPQPLFTPPTPSDHYTQAEWSPDGTYIYYTHYNDQYPPDAQLNPPYDIYRISYPGGQSEKIISNAFWSRVSRDSNKLVYVALEPLTGKNELFVANADGSNPQSVTFSGPGIPEIIDAPIFSPDGQSILFSAPTPTQSYQPNWFDKLTGVKVVKAHNVPSDWWSVSITGGDPIRLTQIQVTGLFADVSPDQKHFASASGNGIFIMSPDGSGLTYLTSPAGGIAGTVRWIP